MNKTTIIISALTAFIIATVGSLVVVLVGGKPTVWQVLTAVGLGLGVAAKDTRSLLKLPPVSDTDTKFTVKPRGPLVWLLCGFLSFGLIGGLGAGCTAPPQRIAFNSLHSVQTVTVGAYDGYVAEVIAGRVRTNDLPKVSEQFNVFQASFRVALDAVEFNTNALAPENLQILSGDLLNLITTLTPKSK